mmetsp:Transcript_16218/g.24348  ORF Transcript_16218/g.24348 Transcript_16218/m.24348 type:complete len:347 (+) Transcript_16218:61-1101(+)
MVNALVEQNNNEIEESGTKEDKLSTMESMMERGRSELLPNDVEEIECTMPKARKLRALLKEEKVMLLPGVYDCVSAKLCEQAGFEVIYTSGFSISASLLGMPDIGLMTATENIETIGRIAGSVSMPVIADCDTGYGGRSNVVRVVREMVQRQVAAIALEDQEWPKKCGHFEGKKVIPMQEHAGKIRAAVAARGDSGLVIVARTDARQVLGLDAAIERAREYYRAGADVVFVEAMQSEEEMRLVSQALPGVPLLCNYIEGGKTPAKSAKALLDIGKNYSFLMFSTAAMLAATKALQDLYAHLLEHGSTQGYSSNLESFAEFKRLVNLDEYNAVDAGDDEMAKTLHLP